MIIRIGDTIEDDRGRQGELINIGIATEKDDIAAEKETSCNAQVYDTDLGYTGAVTFGGSNWCYFSQIKKIVKRKADDLE